MQETVTPAISVVIPTYNRANTIKYCLDSVLAQTYGPLEVIIVDDCSTDDTVQVVKNYLDPRVRCIVLEKNSGAQAARNCGIQEAKGDWIAFQDSDDEWMADKLEKQVHALAKVDFNPWVVVHTNCITLEVSTGCEQLLNIPAVEGSDGYRALLSHPGPMFQGMLVSRRALQEIGFLDEKVLAFQEWDTAIRLGKHCRFIYLGEPLFTYYLHQGETISKNKKKDIQGYLYILNKFQNEIKVLCGQKVWEEHLWGQLYKCLELGLWKESDIFFRKISSRKVLKFNLRLLRRLHVKPSQMKASLSRMKRKVHSIKRNSLIEKGRKL